MPAGGAHRLVRAVGLASALLAVIAGTSPAQALPCTSTHWVGSWEAAPGDGLGGLSGLAGTQAVPGSGHEDVLELLGGTFRVVLTPHIGGSELRVHLSNRFGTQTVQFSHATVAIEDSGAGIVPSSLRALTVSGRESFTVGPGQEVVSDPVALSFGAFASLAVSLYVSHGIGQITEHLTGRQISYFAPLLAGDQAAAQSGAAFSVETTARPFVDGLDVLATAGSGAVAALGDSITDGYGGLHGDLANLLNVSENPLGVDSNSRWPDFLARRLIDARRPLSVIDAGISGNRVLYDGAYDMAPIFAVYGPAALARLQQDVLDQGGVSDVIVLEGTNDIGAPPYASGAQVIIGLIELVHRIHAAGLPVQLGTLTPFNGAAYLDPTREQARGQVNAWIRSQHLSDGVVDFDLAVRNPANPPALLPAYDSGDHLHPSPDGYAAMAAAVDLSLLRSPVCAQPTPSASKRHRHRNRHRKSSITKVPGRK